jgi:hypothetical protein
VLIQANSLGRIGVSGDAFIPHLHIMRMDSQDFLHAEGLPTYFKIFAALSVRRQSMCDREQSMRDRSSSLESNLHFQLSRADRDGKPSPIQQQCSCLGAISCCGGWMGCSYLCCGAWTLSRETSWL